MAEPFPETTPKKRRVQSVLFMCNYNAVRSVAAEAIARAYLGKSTYVQSAGVRSGESVLEPSAGDGAIARYLPVYSVWVALVTFLFPFLFGFR